MDVRAAGTPGTVGSQRPQCNQFSWLLCQRAPRLAAYEQDKRGSDALDGAGCRERYGTQLPLAGRFSTGWLRTRTISAIAARLQTLPYSIRKAQSHSTAQTEHGTAS